MGIHSRKERPFLEHFKPPTSIVRDCLISFLFPHLRSIFTLPMAFDMDTYFNEFQDEGQHARPRILYAFATTSPLALLNAASSVVGPPESGKSSVSSGSASCSDVC
jgi:hypothetical protein